MIANGSTVASIGKWGGRALVGLGFGLGMYDDITNKDKTVGQAVVHNGVSTGLSLGTATGVATVATFILGSNPVGWAAVGVGVAAMGASTLVDWGFSTAYEENFLGVRDGLDTVGEWFDETVNTVGQAISFGI